MWKILIFFSKKGFFLPYKLLVLQMKRLPLEVGQDNSPAEKK
jgi:hypothetical protein